MDRIIEVQIRMIIGTVVMLVVGSLIFGTNLTVYGVTIVIRWAIYIQGALLVITTVAYPHEVYNIIIDALYWLLEVNAKYKIFTQNNDAEESIFPLEADDIETELFVHDVEEELGKESMSKKDKTAAFLLSVEKAIRGEMSVGIGSEEDRVNERKDLNADEKIRFDALWVAIDNVETARMILLGEGFRVWNAVSENTATVPMELISGVA